MTDLGLCTMGWKHHKSRFQPIVHKKTCETKSCRSNSLLDSLNPKVDLLSNYLLSESTLAESTSTERVSESLTTVFVSTFDESTDVVSVAAALPLHDTNDTDAVRAIAATAAKTNFFIIFSFLL